MELKPLPSHLKYAYLDAEQQFPVIIASNLHWEQEDKLLSVLRQHKKDLPFELMYDASNSALGAVLGQKAGVGSKIVVFSDHVALRFLLKKPDAKPRLIWWMLLLQEFNIKIRDKKVEIEHRAYSIVKQCNLAYDQVGKGRKFQLQELDELHLEAYENSQIYKQKVKQFHDQQILRKEFQVGQKVLLFNSRLKLIVGKLHSRWDGSFVITNVFPYGVFELKGEHTNDTFQVNGNQIKLFHEGLPLIAGNVDTISLMESTPLDDTP
ncbi:hypothetical protein CR513_31595, partial [Mucuna pruriens]